MKVTVAILIQQLYMKNVQILAGKRGLQNQVDGISFFEDIENGVNMAKNTVIFTNQHFFSICGERDYQKIITTYVRMRVAALCFKLPEKQVIPENFIRAANRYSLPVLTLPSDTIVSSVISGIAYEIFYRNGYNLSMSYEDNFIQEMILTEQDSQMMIKRARMMGIKVDEYLAVMLVCPKKTAVAYDICSYCKEVWGSNCFTCSRNGIAMVVVRMKQPFETTRDRLRVRAEELYDLLKKKFPSESVNIGVGHCYESVSELRKSYYEAKSALLAGKMKHMNRGVFCYDQMGIYRILFDLKNRDELYQVQSETAGVLKKYDEEYGTEFLTTIRTYFEEFCSVQGTAKALFVHYNTIRYRINKIQEIFGWNLMDMGDCVYLFIGLNADEYLEEEDNPR